MIKREGYTLDEILNNLNIFLRFRRIEDVEVKLAFCTDVEMDILKILAERRYALNARQVYELLAEKYVCLGKKPPAYLTIRRKLDTLYEAGLVIKRRLAHSKADALYAILCKDLRKMLGD